MLLLPLLLKATLLHLASGSYHPFHNGFYYNHIMNDNSDEQDKVDYFSGSRLVVEASRDPVYSYNGANATLPCRYRYEPDQGPKHKIRIKWSKVRDDYTKEQDVMVAVGKTYVAFGDFKGRAHISQAGEESWHGASLVISDVRLKDDGKFRCTVIDGLEDESDVYPIRLPRKPCGGVHLAPGIRSYGPRHRHLHRFDAFCFSSALKGEVFYLDRPAGMTLEEAKQSCQDAAAEIARVGQLYSAWKLAGLDRCNAGWLADGSVRYPIVTPRANCGPAEPGVRSFGFPRKGRFGVFCYRER
ncbi:hypothetical protein EK904_008655 [Melospiza melodia maxima]|nr:hypothetical protein EK904_008655 [Melospiza melodia maxima]